MCSVFFIMKDFFVLVDLVIKMDFCWVMVFKIFICCFEGIILFFCDVVFKVFCDFFRSYLKYSLEIKLCLDVFDI